MGEQMVTTADQVGSSRWRQHYGRYFEYVEVSASDDHRTGCAIGEADSTRFTLLTMTRYPLHFDAAHAVKSEFGCMVVNNCFTQSRQSPE